MLSFLNQRLLPALSHEVLPKHGETVGEWPPRPFLWTNHDRITSTLNFDLVTLQLKLARDSDSLAVAVHQELRILLSRYHHPPYRD